MKWSVAIIGNSGSLLNHEYGKQIDNHNVVVRLNDAPVEGFEKYMGTRTTWRFISYPCTNWDFEGTLIAQNLLILSYSYKKLAEGLSKMGGLNWVQALPEDFILKCDAMIGTVSKKRALKKKIGWDIISPYKKLASLGLKAIEWELKKELENPYSDRQVYLYGFDFYSNPKTYHYWEELKHPNPSMWHDWEKEKQIIKNYENNGKLTII